MALKHNMSITRTIVAFSLLLSVTIIRRVDGQGAVATTVIVQEENGCKAYYDPQHWTVQTTNVNVRSQSSEFYNSNQNCIAILRGKDMYQWEITVTQLSVDKKAQVDAQGVPRKCFDFLKLFNGPRVDNARLIPQMDVPGLCGDFGTGNLPTHIQHYKTSQNYLTIQFKTDEIFDSMPGFTMTLRQYKWTSNPNPYPNPGGWNDGTLNEFSYIWDSQAMVPGEAGPGYDYSDYDLDPYGVSCYECELCKLNNFKPDVSNAATKDGCFLCSKEWDDRYAQARRKCYTRRQYINLLLGFREQAIGDDGQVTLILGCRKFINDYGKGINYCFCESDHCNGAEGSHVAHLSMIMSLSVSVLLIFRIF